MSVPLPSFDAKRGICAYVLPPVATSASMRMYCAKQRASVPLSIALPATEQVGSVDAGQAGRLGLRRDGRGRQAVLTV